jgi:hypothetical protein
MVDFRVLIIAVLAALAAGAGLGAWTAWDVRSTRADLDLLGLRTTYDNATAAAKDESRAVEQALQLQINDLSKKATDDVHQIDSHAAASVASTDSLLHAATERFSAATCDPGVARRGQAATGAAYLYSQLLGESQTLARGLAEEADRARSAGASCETAYDLIRGKLNGLARGPAVTGK